MLCFSAFVEMPFGIQCIMFPYVWMCFLCHTHFIGSSLALKNILKCMYMDIGIAHLLGLWEGYWRNETMCL